MEKTAEQVYNERWKVQVENEDGTINMQVLQDILKDMTILEKNTSSVFEEFAPISNPYTSASDVIRAIREEYIDKQTLLIDLATEIEDGKIAMNFDDLAQYLGVDLATKLEVKQQLEQRGQSFDVPVTVYPETVDAKTDYVSQQVYKLLDQIQKDSNGAIRVSADANFLDGRIYMTVENKQ